MTTLADAMKRPERKGARPSASRPAARGKVAPGKIAKARSGKATAGKGSKAEVFRLSESPSHLLRRADQFAAETFLKSGLPDGVTLRQTVLLAAIAEAEGASQSDLVRITGVDRSTLAEMMARMERKGLIARSAAADDGRAKSVSLTADGRERLDAAMPAMREIDEALVAALPRNRRAPFRAALLSLAEAADEAHLAEDAAQKKEKKEAKASKKASAKERRQRRKKRKNRR
jgi:MarR family transcriptional regulator, temperature-dependent positive regulator of motility